MILHILTGIGYDGMPFVTSTSRSADIRPLVLSFPAYFNWHIDTWEIRDGVMSKLSSAPWH